MNRAYLLVTETKIDASSIDLTAIKDSMFKAKKHLKVKRAKFAEKKVKKDKIKEKSKRSPELLAQQKVIDRVLLE